MENETKELYWSLSLNVVSARLGQLQTTTPNYFYFLIQINTSLLFFTFSKQLSSMPMEGNILLPSYSLRTPPDHVQSQIIRARGKHYMQMIVSHALVRAAVKFQLADQWNKVKAGASGL